ncbi:MAG: hypothetical protein ABUM51_10275, partial [Bacteroidota bacterium]
MAKLTEKEYLSRIIELDNAYDRSKNACERLYIEGDLELLYDDMRQYGFRSVGEIYEAIRWIEAGKDDPEAEIRAAMADIGPEPEIEEGLVN